MYRAFWRNAGHSKARGIPRDQRMKMMARTVLLTDEFRFSRWLPQKNVAAELDNLHTRFAIILQPLARRPAEPALSFALRRGRAGRELCKLSGVWSQQWWIRAAQRDAHLRRHPDTAVRALLIWHGCEWLQQRRSRFVAADPTTWNTWSVHAARTDTRVCAEVAHQSLNEGIYLATQRTRRRHEPSFPEA